MKKIKVGYLPLYIKLYDDSGSDRTVVVNHMNKLIAALEQAGLEVVQADEVCRIKEEFDRAAAKFNAAGVDAVITQHLAYSPSLESIEALLRLEAPIVVLDTTVDYALMSVADRYNGIMPNHGIHGVQDMCCMLKKNHKPYYLCVGHIQDGKVIDETVGMCRAAAASRFYKTARVGSVGGSFTGMGDFLISDEDYRRDIGAEVVYMSTEEAVKYEAAVTEAEIDAEIASDKAKYQSEITWEAEYRAATRSGLAVRKWMADKDLNCCTVNFLTLDKVQLGKMPFPECCKMMERGQGYAGEGDVLTAGLVGALSSVYPDTTFTEMFCPDWEKDLILLSHMGESNPNLAQWKPLLADAAFNYNSCGNTVSMYNCLKPGKVVYVNLAPMDGHYHLIIFEGEMLDAGLENGAYRHSTQGWLKPCCKLPEFLKKYSMAGGTHHSAMVYGANIEEIRAFGEMMGFEVIEIR